MRKTLVAGAISAVLIALAGTYVAFADSEYHTERLTFSLTAGGSDQGHPELRSGQVVNIHPNGPVVGAMEQYVLNGAQPNTTYHIALYALSECGGDVLDEFPVETAQLTTGPSGNGKASFVFSADDLAPFSGAVVGAQWVAAVDGVAIYETGCTVVMID